MNKERLIKIAEFLENLPEHKFDFSAYVILGSKQPLEALCSLEEHCGTTACAIGWLPAIFPESFKWVKDWSDELSPALVENDEWNENDIRDFLEIDQRNYDFLFIPGSSSLYNEAKPKEVAEQIRQFILTDGKTMDDYYKIHMEIIHFN